MIGLICLILCVMTVGAVLIVYFAQKNNDSSCSVSAGYIGIVPSATISGQFTSQNTIVGQYQTRPLFGERNAQNILLNGRAFEISTTYAIRSLYFSTLATGSENTFTIGTQRHTLFVVEFTMGGYFYQYHFSVAPFVVTGSSGSSWLVVRRDNVIIHNASWRTATFSSVAERPQALRNILNSTFAEILNYSYDSNRPINDLSFFMSTNGPNIQWTADLWTPLNTFGVTYLDKDGYLLYTRYLQQGQILTATQVAPGVSGFVFDSWQVVSGTPIGQPIQSNTILQATYSQALTVSLRVANDVNIPFEWRGLVFHVYEVALNSRLISPMSRINIHHPRIDGMGLRNYIVINGYVGMIITEDLIVDVYYVWHYFNVRYVFDENLFFPNWHPSAVYTFMVRYGTILSRPILHGETVVYPLVLFRPNFARLFPNVSNMIFDWDFNIPVTDDLIIRVSAVVDVDNSLGGWTTRSLTMGQLSNNYRHHALLNAFVNPFESVYVQFYFHNFYFLDNSQFTFDLVGNGQYLVLIIRDSDIFYDTYLVLSSNFTFGVYGQGLSQENIVFIDGGVFFHLRVRNTFIQSNFVYLFDYRDDTFFEIDYQKIFDGFYIRDILGGYWNLFENVTISQGAFFNIVTQFRLNSLIRGVNSLYSGQVTSLDGLQMINFYDDFGRRFFRDFGFNLSNNQMVSFNHSNSFSGNVRTISFITQSRTGLFVSTNVILSLNQLNLFTLDLVEFPNIGGGEWFLDCGPFRINLNFGQIISSLVSNLGCHMANAMFWILSYVPFLQPVLAVVQMMVLYIQPMIGFLQDIHALPIIGSIVIAFLAFLIVRRFIGGVT